jgi:hypothetical protein
MSSRPSSVSDTSTAAAHLSAPREPTPLELPALAGSPTSALDKPGRSLATTAYGSQLRITRGSHSRRSHRRHLGRLLTASPLPRSELLDSPVKQRLDESITGNDPKPKDTPILMEALNSLSICVN